RQPKGFQKVCDSLNHFLITLSLQQAVMSTPCLLAFDGVSTRESVNAPARALWLNGHYVEGRPNMDFFDVPGHDVLMNRVWLGSHSDAALRLIRTGVTFDRIKCSERGG